MDKKNIIIEIFKKSIEEVEIDPRQVRYVWNNKYQIKEWYSIEDILKGVNSIKQALMYFRMYDKDNERVPNAIEKDFRKRVISKVIIKDLIRKGKFLQENGIGYYFYKKDKKVYPIGCIKDEKPTEIILLLQKLYDVNRKTAEGKFIIEEVKNFALNDGEEVTICKFFHYDDNKKVLYIHDRASGIFKLDGKNIKFINNGSEGIYFISSPIIKEKIKYIPPKERKNFEIIGEMDEWKNKGNLLQRIILNRTNFTFDTALEPELQRLQLLFHFYSFPFIDILMTKPIMVFLGKKKSGKTTTLRMIGKFLLGKNYEVESLAKNEEDARVTASNRLFYFLDNVDKECSWLPDFLATISTGIRFSKRELYSDARVFYTEPKCFIGISSRTPHFDRDDVIDRMLLFHVKELPKEKKKSERMLYKNILDNYNTLWSIYMDDLNKIVAVLKDFDFMNATTEHRFSDWAILTRVIGKALNINEEKRILMLEMMEKEKDAFLMRNETLLPILRKFADSPRNNGEWMSIYQLFSELIQISQDFEIENPKELGWKIKKYESALENILGLQRRKNKKTGTFDIRIPSRKQIIEELKIEEKTLEIDKFLNDKNVKNYQELFSELEKNQEILFRTFEQHRDEYLRKHHHHYFSLLLIAKINEQPIFFLKKPIVEFL